MAVNNASLLRRISAFYFFPLATFIVPFVTLPFLARWTSEAEWVALVTGYSLGGMASLVVLLGFPLTGAQQVAACSLENATQLYSQSVAARQLVLLGSLPLLGAASWFLAPGGQFTGTFGMALAAATLGMSGSWFSIGLGRPSWLAKYEVVPRILGAVAGVVAVLLGGGVPAYAVVQIASVLAGVSLMNRKVRSESPTTYLKPGLREAWTTILPRFPAMATELLTGVYRVLPVSMVALAASSATVASYGASDRLFRMSLFVVVALSNGLISWVIRHEEPWEPKRAQRALAAHAGLGGAGLVAFVVLGPWFSRVFYGGTYDMPLAVATCFGLAFLAVSLETALIRFYLLARDRSVTVLTAALAGALLAPVLFLTLPRFFGITGAAVAVLSLEALQVIWLSVALARVPARLRAPSPS